MSELQKCRALAFGRRAAESVLSLLYPPRCMFCDELLEEGERREGICRHCLPAIPFVGARFCLKCGKALSCADEDLCRDCGKREDEEREHVFDAGRSLLVYTDEVSGLISRYKFGNRRDLGRRLAVMMARELRAEITAMAAGTLVPVPLHPKKLEERGFDQTDLLARELAAEWNAGVRSEGLQNAERAWRLAVRSLLVRSRPTRPMKELDSEERMRNIAEALSLTPGVTRVPERVILVDDIYTTGSTMDACAGVLKRAGVRKVFFVTAATGQD